MEKIANKRGCCCRQLFFTVMVHIRSVVIKRLIDIERIYEVERGRGGARRSPLRTNARNAAYVVLVISR